MPVFDPHERQALQWTPRLCVSEWSDEFRHVADGPARGKWSNLTHPILAGIMDAFHEKGTDHIVIAASRQDGKTSGGIVNPLLYFLLYRGSDAMVMSSTQTIVEDLWERKILPAIKRSPALNPLLLSPREWGKIDTGRRFRNGSFLYMVGSDSKAALISRSLEFFFADETDYMCDGKKEKTLHALNLARGRTDAYPLTRKIVWACTVTTPEGIIWEAYLEGDQRKPYVRCPKCERYILLLWGHECEKALFELKDYTGGMRFEDSSPARATKTAYFECPACAGEIRDVDRPGMLRDHKWVPGPARAFLEDNTAPVEEKEDGARIASFWFGKLYSPLWKFGLLAAEFVKAQRNEEAWADFQMHTLAVPYRPPHIEIDDISTALIRSHIVQEVSDDYRRGRVPAEADFVVMGADPGRRGIHWAAWAFRRSDATCWLIDNGVVEVYSPEGMERGVSRAEERAILQGAREIISIAREGWEGFDGRMVPASATAIDARYGTSAICAAVVEGGQRSFFAVMGSAALGKVYNWRMPKFRETPKPGEIRAAHYYSEIQANRVRLLHIDADWSKLQVHRALLIPLGHPGTMHLFPGVDHSFIKHLQAQRWIEDEKGGRWEQIKRNDHWLDASGYAFVMADLLKAKPLGDVVVPSATVHAGYAHGGEKKSGWAIGR